MRQSHTAATHARGELRVLVWKWAWLSPSETFVRNQVAALQKSAAVVTVGAARVQSVLADAQDRILFDTSRPNRLLTALLRSTGFSPRLRQQIQRGRPDVVHAHFANDAFAVRRISKRQGVPLAVTLHGRDVTADARQPGLRGWYYRLRLRKLFRDAALLMPVSEHIRRVALALGAPEAKLVVHRIGVPDASQTRSGRLPAEILAVGRLVEKKGLTHLLDAVASLPAALRDTPVRIVGDGPLRAPLEAQAQRLGLQVDFLGLQPPHAVESLLARGPIVCAPSVTARDGDEEGLPTVLVEAARSGCALVAFDHAGIGEIVRDHQTGLLVPEGDVAALAGALGTLLSDEAERAALAQASRDIWAAEFDIASQTDRLISLFRQLAPAQ